jgi:serine/threonine-protein kinase
MVLDERYRLDAELGRGGMGVVYRAHDIVLKRDVAVKVMSRAPALGTEGRARLMHEAQAAAQLNHPNIVSVYDAGEVDGSPFIVMELVEGDSLHTRRPEALDDTLAIARQVCAALEHAHAHGIIHRDLKPENVVSIRHFVEDAVTALDIDSTIVADVVLAVDEAISTSSFTATRASLGLLGSK